MSIRPEYEYRSPNEDQLARIEFLRGNFSTLADIINSVCPGANKYRAKALTDLEVVSMLVNKAITHGE